MHTYIHIDIHIHVHQIDKTKEMNKNKTLRSTVNKLTRKKPKDKHKIN